MIGQDRLQQLQIKYGNVVNDLMAEMAEMSLSEKLEWNTPFGSVTFKVGNCENELKEIIGSLNVDEQKKAGVYCVNFPESEKVRIPQDKQTLVFVMNEKDWLVDSIRKCVKEVVKHQAVYIIINYKDKRLKYAAVNEVAFAAIDNHIKELINKDNEPSDTLEEIKPTIDEQIDSLEVDMSLVHDLEKEFGDISLSKVRKLLAKRYEHLCYEDLFPY